MNDITMLGIDLGDFYQSVVKGLMRTENEGN